MTVLRQAAYLALLMCLAAYLALLMCLAAPAQLRAAEMIYQGKTTTQWIELLKSNDPGMRLSAAWALGEIGPHAVAAVPALIAVFTDQNTNARWNALEAVGKIGPGAAQAVPDLIEVLKHQEATTRWKAAWSLGAIGPGASAAVPSLTNALQDGDPDVRAHAAQALGKIGAQAASAAPALAALLQDQDWQVRMYAAGALGTVGPSAATAIPALQQALNDANEAVRLRAQEALKAIEQQPAQSQQQPAPTQPEPTQPAQEATAALVTASPGLRRETMVILAPSATADGKMKLESQTIHRYVTPLTFELYDEQNQLLQQGIVPLTGERELSLPAGAEGYQMLRLDSGLNRYVLTTETPHCFLASEAYRLRVNQFAGNLYFFVPEGCKRFEVRVLCESPNEGALCQVIDPEGNVAAQVAGEIAQWEALTVEPAAAMCGKPWRLTIAKDETTVLDDVDLYLTGDVTPLMSMNPQWAAAIAPAMATMQEEGE